jgi:hypothetical protein
MNPYYALSAIFLLGLRGIEKKLKLQTPPISHFSPEDRKTGKARILYLVDYTADGINPLRSRCYLFPWNLPRLV